ncbi:PadR family transcriptional regulator [Paenibacillus sp. GCM10023248]|uniref:PadR family transcriptional regulator n=1 Tax=Bacillales TaxID=1385 RepID=UPI002377E8BD|nr:MULTISPECIES: PadR family transcriptional regulator [Bacillales]MDD9267263.1 PadR family transcriptional regulator [Paenibacillus sp. MAHUQ-63]MDR6881477.1 DNA-binding PadR family transcriptional regulator [Bacillus sp. 3255]
MSSIRYAMLTLLAREPLSGYDIKQQMNSRMGPFWKAGSNQVYPELAKMEEEGLALLHSVEQNDHRPARKVYAITERGRQELIRWTIEPTEPETMKDEFLLKAYNSWLVESADMLPRFEEKQKEHEKKLAVYSEKLNELNQILDPLNPRDPLLSSISVVEFGVEYEKLYIKWCQQVIEKLRKQEAN